MTRDLRRQALESHKTVSRKAQSKISSRASSAAHSRTASNQGSRHGSDEEDSNLSDSTNWSVNSIDDMLAVEPEEETEHWRQKLADRIEEIIDRKRSSVTGREIALAAYSQFLMRRYAYDEIERKIDTLMPAFLKSVKGEDSVKETCLALKAISLSLITVPSDVAYDALYPVLKKVYTTSESLEVKAAAIHALSVAVTYGGASDSETEEVLDELLEIIESDGSSIEAPDSIEVVKAAIEEWGALATWVEDLEDRTEAAMEAFVEQLDSGDTAVQVSAGENIALLYEKSYTAREEEDGAASDHEDEDGNLVDNSVVKRYEVYRESPQLKNKLAKLATESSRGISKKDRKILHTNFSDILQTVEHPSLGPRYSNAYNQETGKKYGYRLEVRIHRTGRIGINRWWKLHRLQMLRRILGGGFVVHYETNEVVFDTLPVVMSAEKSSENTGSA